MTTACLTQWRWVPSLFSESRLSCRAVRINHEHILHVSLKGELYGDLLWACAWPAESQEQREPAGQGAPSDGTLCWRSVQASRHFLQWHPGSDGLWKQSQVAQLSDFGVMRLCAAERRHIKLYRSINASKIVLMIMFLFVFVGPWLQPTWTRQAAALMPSSTSSSPRRNTTWRQTTHPKRFSINPPWCHVLIYFFWSFFHSFFFFILS